MTQWTDENWRDFFRTQTTAYWVVDFDESLVEVGRELSKTAISNLHPQVHPSRHEGWDQLVLHGIGGDKTGHFVRYGYQTAEEVPWHWTPNSLGFGKLKHWILNKFYFLELHKVALSRLRGGGEIRLHCDDLPGLYLSFNIPLITNSQCSLELRSGSLKPTVGEILILNLCLPHGARNLSPEDRWHLIVMGKPKIFSPLLQPLKDESVPYEF